MFAFLLGLVVHAAPLSFRITHHVSLSEPIQTAYDFRRDGSLVGSYGWSGLHDGHQMPLIVRRGKQIRLLNEETLRFTDVRAALANGNYLVVGLNQVTSVAAIRDQKLIETGPGKAPSDQEEAHYVKAGSDAVVAKLFPVPEGMRDTTGIECVYWYDYVHGLKLGQVDTSCMMEYNYRSCLREPNGRTRPIEACVPGLRGYLVRGIEFVSPDGWFVVDADRRDPHPDPDGVHIGLGAELFWIEPTNSSHRK